MILSTDDLRRFRSLVAIIRAASVDAGEKVPQPTRAAYLRTVRGPSGAWYGQSARPCPVERREESVINAAYALTRRPSGHAERRSRTALAYGPPE